MFSNKCYYDQNFSPLNLSVKYHREFHKWLKTPFTNNYIGNICICSGDTWVCFMCKIWEWKDGWCDTFNLIIIRITTSLYNSYINITGESIYSRDHQYNVHCSSIRQYTYGYKNFCSHSNLHFSSPCQPDLLIVGFWCHHLAYSVFLYFKNL